jgi:hypothetical protein
MAMTPCCNIAASVIKAGISVSGKNNRLGEGEGVTKFYPSSLI